MRLFDRLFGVKINDPYNTMGAAPAPKKADRPSVRPRTAQDNARYDEITRKVIKNKDVDPHDFTDTLDYLKWTDRVDGTWGDFKDGIYALSCTPGLLSRRDVAGYDEVKKLRGK
jgi:hypothetical protein